MVDQVSFYRSCPPKFLSFSNVSDDELFALWAAGHDTYEIATMLGITEAEAANRLPKIRDRRLRGQEWDFVA